MMKQYVEYRDLGRMSYAEALEVQRGRFDGLMAAKGAETDGCAGTIFTVEHPAVYTLGKNGDAGNLLVDESLLRSSGAEFFRTDRGGDITFHGEGQIVGYPVLDLERLGTGLRDYVWMLEQAVIDVLAGYGIIAGRSEGASGVWLGPGAVTEAGAVIGAGAVTDVDSVEKIGKTGRLRKICAIGVRASRYITMHGFALNVTTDLSRFGYINPCGFSDRGVTSMERELGCAPSVGEVREKVVTRLAELLGAELRKL